MDSADDIPLLANTSIQAKSLLHSLEQAAGDISLHMNASKAEYMYFKQEGAISNLSGDPQKLVDKFLYLGSCVSFTESDINIHLTKVWTAIDWLSLTV